MVILYWCQTRIAAYEDIVNNTMGILTQQLEQHGPIVDSVEWPRYFIFDTLSRIALSEDLGFMVNSEDVEGTLAGAQQRFDHWHYWLPMPQHEHLIFKNPLIFQFAKPSSRLAALALRKSGHGNGRPRFWRVSRPTISISRCGQEKSGRH